MKKLIILLFIFKISFALTITEIMYNPEGNDSDREWIEVFNNFNQTIEIISGKQGWRINDGSNHLFEENLVVGPQEIFIIVQDRNLFLREYPNFNSKLVQANFSLKNEAGKIQIFDNNKNLLAEISYQSSCGGNNNSYSIIFENGLCKENKIKGGTPGSLLIVESLISNLTTTNSLNLNQQSISDNIQVSTSTATLTQETTTNQIQPTLIISEFLPNPEGNDQSKEFIEIYNYGEESLDLSYFVLKIGSKRIKLFGQIEPGEYFLITNKEHSFYLRNNGENLALYFNDEKIFSISYQGKAPEGKSFARNQGGGWQFTQPTPGRENVFSESDNLTKEKQDISKQKLSNPIGSNLVNPSFDEKLASAQLLNQKTIEKNYFYYILGSILIILALVFIVWFKL